MQMTMHNWMLLRLALLILAFGGIYAVAFIMGALEKRRNRRGSGHGRGSELQPHDFGASPTGPLLS